MYVCVCVCVCVEEQMEGGPVRETQLCCVLLNITVLIQADPHQGLEDQQQLGERDGCTNDENQCGRKTARIKPRGTIIQASEGKKK